jgi:hypothetical protein
MAIMHRFVVAAAIGLFSIVTSACLEIEQTLTLERDLSGKAGFALNLDMEPIVAVMAAVKKSMEGGGTPTAAELAAARKEMLGSQKSNLGDFEKDKKEFQSKLPAGVTLLDAQAKEDGLKMAASFLLGFDQVAKLKQIEMPKSGDQSNPAGKNPVESPFGGLNVVTEGQTILVTSAVENPVADQQKQTKEMPVDKAGLAMMEQMFKGVRIAFKITSPLEVVEHNAHRREGNTLVWDYNLTSLQKLSPEQMKQGVRVRFRR